MALPGDGFSELAALGMVGVLTLAARWAFRPSRPNRAVQRMDATDSRELGLLTVVATADRATAAARRAQLGEAGIRASTSLRGDGRFDLLVFHRDAERARDLLP